MFGLSKSIGAGFTLAEMIVAVGVLGVMAAMTTAGMSSSAERRAADYDVDYWADTFRSLRAEAMRTGKTVRLRAAPAADGKSVVLTAESQAGAGRTACAESAFGTALYTETKKPRSTFHVYLTGDSGFCFFPDGSSAGGSAVWTARKAEAPEAPANGGGHGGPSAPTAENAAYRFDDRLLIPAGIRARVDVPAGTGLPDVRKDYLGTSEQNRNG